MSHIAGSLGDVALSIMMNRDMGENGTVGVPERSGGWWMLVSPQTIYGTIIVSAVIVAADDWKSDLEVFTLTLATIVMVWVAHIFSELVAGAHTKVQPSPNVREVVAHAMVHSVGLLLAAIVPLLILLVGASGLIGDYTAYFVALTAAVVSLAVVGWFTFVRRGSPWPIRIAGAAGTALMAALVIFLKSLIH